MVCLACDVLSNLTSVRDGNDGPWSSFGVQIGTPPQFVRVLPASSGSSLWVVAPEGCSTQTDPSNCDDLRGGIFDKSTSATWAEKGIYELDLSTEIAWGYSGNGDFGFDNITLADPGSGGVTLNDSVLAAIASKDFFIGSLGLNPWGVNFTDYNEPIPGPINMLLDQKHIAGRSWGYTAGARYSPTQTYGSLTFGGYDASRFIPNDLTITRDEDTSRDLLLGVQTITSGENSLLSDGFMALIDSTVGQLWLPTAVCERFEDVFGITWDESLNLYLVNSTLHDQLQAQNPNITFTIGSTPTSQSIVNIALPYAAFDLTASWPLTPNGSSSYFPIRRAANATQYVLGRPFLQEAYVIVDYDRNNFSVSQALFPDNDVPQKLVTIFPPDEDHASSSLPKGAIAGIVVACVILITAVAIAIVKLSRRWKKSPRKMQNLDATEQMTTIPANGFYKPELEDNSHALRDLSAYNKQRLAGTEIGATEIDGRGATERHQHVQTTPAGFGAAQTPLLGPGTYSDLGTNGSAEIDGTNRIVAETEGSSPRAELESAGVHDTLHELP